MMARIDPRTLKSWLHDGAEIALLDVREHGQHGDAHLFHAVPPPYSRLELDVVRLVPRRSTRLVVHDSGDAPSAVPSDARNSALSDAPNSAPIGAGDHDVAERAATRLATLGHRDVSVLEGGARAWREAGFVLLAGVNPPSKTFGELAEQAYHTSRISADRLAGMLASGEPVALLDGRPLAEFRKMNIPGAVCCPNGELAFRVRNLVPDPATPIVINRAGRTRGIIDAQTLINLGLPNPVFALENGTRGWVLADHALEHGGSRRYPPDSGDGALRPAAEALARRFDVPSVDAATGTAWAADPLRTLFLRDVRTAEEFAAGSLPGARHTRGGQLMRATDQYVGVRGARLVLFDDDGVRAPTVASWMRQMGHDASVLAGGLKSGLALSPHDAPQPRPLDLMDAARRYLAWETGLVAQLDAQELASFRLPGRP